MYHVCLQIENTTCRPAHTCEFILSRYQQVLLSCFLTRINSTSIQELTIFPQFLANLPKNIFGVEIKLILFKTDLNGNFLWTITNFLEKFENKILTFNRTKISEEARASTRSVPKFCLLRSSLFSRLLWLYCKTISSWKSHKRFLRIFISSYLC